MSEVARIRTENNAVWMRTWEDCCSNGKIRRMVHGMRNREVVERMRRKNVVYFPPTPPSDSKDETYHPSKYSAK